MVPGAGLGAGTPWEQGQTLSETDRPSSVNDSDAILINTVTLK